MAKPIIEMCGLELHEFKAAHIEPFYQDISFETERELRVAYRVDPMDVLLDCLKEDMVYSVMRDGKPLAITGLNSSALMWLLFGKGLRRNSLRFARSSPALIEYYHQFANEIRCEIWDKSDMIAKWLMMLGFEQEAVLSPDAEFSFLRFVRCADVNDCVDSPLSRPVMH